MTTEPPRPIKDSNEMVLWFQVRNFLVNEADLLDNAKLDEWVDLLTEDIEYRIPVRMTRERGVDSEFSDDSFHVRDDLDGIMARKKRFDTEYTWFDNPPYRVRRFVSNVAINALEDNHIHVKSNILMTRSRKDEPQGINVSGERHDRIRRDGDTLKLAEREVLLDHTVLNVNAISLKDFF